MKTLHSPHALYACARSKHFKCPITGNSTSAPLLHRLCGVDDVPTEPLYSSGDVVTITFTSDDWYSSRGFFITATPGKRLTVTVKSVCQHLTGLQFRGHLRFSLIQDINCQTHQTLVLYFVRILPKTKLCFLNLLCLVASLSIPTICEFCQKEYRKT